MKSPEERVAWNSCLEAEHVHSDSSILIPAIRGCRRAAVTNWKDQTSDGSLLSLKLAPEKPAEVSLPTDQCVTDLSEEGISLCEDFPSDRAETPSSLQNQTCAFAYTNSNHRLEQAFHCWTLNFQSLLLSNSLIPRDGRKKPSLSHSKGTKSFLIASCHIYRCSRKL